MNTSLPPVAATIPCMAEIDTTVAPMTIAEFQDLIRERYHATDAARGVAPTFLWFAEEFGELAEALAWLATLANVTDVDLTKAIHRKYIADGGPGGTK
jgi:NTP pyrophosphatase (non-canonical NTP hydrolase)